MTDVSGDAPATATSADEPSVSTAAKQPLRTLLVDNYDSFTYNLFQLLAEVNGCSPRVVFNDAKWGDVAALLPQVDCIVISPGPGFCASRTCSEFRIRFFCAFSRRTPGAR